MAGVPVCREALVKLPRQPKKAKRLGKIKSGDPLRKRGHVIPLRLTDQELAHLNRCAAASGLPREEYLRSLIMGKTITPRPCTHHADLLRKVAGLCNNANQLARRANSTGMAGPESVEEMARIARVVWEEVRENW